MGNSCCHTESPCGSVEERSGLLKDDSKATACAGGTVVGGTCGPERDDDIRRSDEPVPMKQGPENGEPNNVQENGPSQKESVQTAPPSPREASEVEGNGAPDEDVKEAPVELLQCTLQTQQGDKAAAHWEVSVASNAAAEEETAASVKDDVPGGASLAAEAVGPEKPPDAETNTTTEHITESATRDDDDGGGGGGGEEEEEEAFSRITAAEPSGEVAQNNEVLLVPNAELAAAAGPVSSITAVSQETNSKSLSRAGTEDSDNSSPEDTKSRDVSRSSSGPEPAGLDRSGEDRDCASSDKEPETTAPADASRSLESDRDAKPDPKCTTTSSKEVAPSEEKRLKVQDEDDDVPKTKEDGGMKKKEEEEESAATEAETQEVTGKEEQLDADVKADAAAEKEGGLGISEEDLYRGAEELSASQSSKPGPPPELETKLLKVEDRCSLSPAVDILSYSEREWKGNTAKSALIKKGYKEMSQRFGSVRRVRGDNYCALRATLFQVLSHSTQLPAWLQEDDIALLPNTLEAREGLISQWTFPDECLQGDGTGDATQQLKGYVELLRNKWQAAVDCVSAAERLQLCERVFQGGEEELGLLEALKLLMLGRAVELHGCMQGGGDVPLFCWLLFARDSSDCPRSFLSNHLGHVGLSAGLEQVEMFLLGYALQCTIQVYRLYKADSEEFVTFYPDDHKDDWQSVSLVTEDDRHYNVPVVEAAELHEELPSS
ncbi:dentin matrix acidic phosphoprotein 1 [Embiotoca jacksoni]|uniref:dentin matrix acidic phosphoprotein 1 n=1 Tax=Embiotoca jacksoni TaxID=100190 RepID=UPI00370487B6